ncbi:flavodoxin domain-containing protein, partial [Escherichia sp. TWPC-MK]
SFAEISTEPGPHFGLGLEALQEQKPDLSAVRFGAIGIGSREYDTFCGAIDKLEAELKNSGAKQTGETLKINILDHDIPEDPAEEWLGSWVLKRRSIYLEICSIVISY